jgi:hypothetical protein
LYAASHAARLDFFTYKISLAYTCSSFLVYPPFTVSPTTWLATNHHYSSLTHHSGNRPQANATTR